MDKFQQVIMEKALSSGTPLTSRQLLNYFWKIAESALPNKHTLIGNIRDSLANTKRNVSEIEDTIELSQILADHYNKRQRKGLR